MSREEQSPGGRPGGFNASRSFDSGASVRTKKIFVGGLPPALTSDEFRAYFETYGPVSDAVIMIGGGNGTLNELTIAYGHKPVVVLEGTGGWADRIRGALYEGKYLDERRVGEIHFAQSAQEAVDKAFHLADERREVGP